MAAATDPITYFSAQTTNANSTAYPMSFPNRRGVFTAYGTPNGSTVTLRWSPDNGTTYLIAKDINGNNLAFTANGYGIVELPLGVLTRCDVASAGASTSMSANLSVI